MNSRFLKKTIIYIIGNFSSKILTALLIPIYAYFVSADDLGNYDYIVALMNIIIPVVFFNMWDSILKYAINNNNKNILKSIYINVFFIVIINILIFICIYLTIYRFGIISYPSFKLSIVMMLSYGLINIWQYSCRAFQQNLTYAISGVVSSLVNLIMILILVVGFKLGLNGLIYSYIISMTVAILLIEFKIKLFSYFDYKYLDFQLLKKMCKFSAPIVLNTISLWGMSGISKIICVNYLNASANGIFSFATKFGSIITVFGSIIGAVIIEEAYLVNDLDEYRIRFSKLINEIFSIYIIILWIAIPAINIIFDILWINNVYYPSKMIIPVITLSAVFSSVSTNFGSAFQVTDKTSYVFITSLIGSIISIIFSILFVNSIGVLGIAFGQLMGNLALIISRALFAYKLTKLNIGWKNQIIKITLFILIAIFSYRVTLIYNFILLLICSVIILMLYKKQIKTVLKKIFRVTNIK